jgi:3-(methylthio)propionyl---CoA ligase
MRVAEPRAEDIIAHCRVHLAAHKVPRHVVFADIPKTSTARSRS